jgi:hypothetical protein
LFPLLLADYKKFPLHLLHGGGEGELNSKN